MPPETPDNRAVLQQFAKIMEGALFARSEQLSRFLRFLLERHLAGRDLELKESVIGVEVFGRSPEYNPRLDPIVRTEARRLRSRLTEYYAEEGKDDPVVIEIPKGGYTPSIQQIEPVPPAGAPRYLPAVLAGAAIVLALAAWAGLKSRRTTR